MELPSEWWTRMRDLIARSAALAAESQRVTEQSEAVQARLEALFEQADKVCQRVEAIKKRPHAPR